MSGGVDGFFERASAGFVDFLLDNGVKISEKVQVWDYRDVNQGRGLKAIQDIEKDEVLFSVPRSVILNVETSSLPEGVKMKLKDLGQWEALIITILYEKYTSFSKWIPYFEVLPSSNFNNLMFWDQDDLVNLGPSLVLDRIGKVEAEEMYKKIFPQIVQSLGLYELLKDVSIDEFHKVASTIMSYSFDVSKSVDTNEEDEEEEEEEEEFIKTMVPLADTLNADTNLCNAHLIYTKDALVMTAISKIGKGEQVYNSYGEHPNSEILRRYGYVEPNGSKFDFGEILLTSIEKNFSEFYNIENNLMTLIIKSISKSEFLTEMENSIIFETYECYKDGETIPEFILLAQVLTLVGLIHQSEDGLEAETFKLEQFINRLVKKSFMLIEDGKLTKSTKENIIKIMEARITSYTNFLKENKLSSDNTDIHKLRVSMAKSVLKSELDSLNNTKLKFATNFKLIDDEKMIRNVLKRKMATDDTIRTKKAKK
ncbi:hypothetical protein PACTADRAFT_74475 [Pachysolen tannophilus NRRL Y-2460]|uniref:Ribosomal lysine N-methyltransferase 4 n=1 Tax=Pachysolen tannophilus NRRL Y-2460 TaxID=669874 RepID=A0A1E4TYL7_PACTA|nr:hypothetical protein PACTADRAFT_74475 [Pachysolen tannophilus NRRL Y-2460]